MSVAAFVRPPSGLHAIAVRELSSPRYRWSDPPPSSRPWWQTPMEWVGQRWNELLQAVFGRVHGGTASAVVGDVVLVMAIALVVAFGVRFLLTISLDARAVRVAEASTARIDSSEWYRRANERASSGDFTAASRCLLGAAVALLREREAIEPSAGATIGELRRALQATAPQSVGAFATIARVFAIGAYGERSLGRDEFDGAAVAFRTLERAT